ncbi:MAG: hypothetical protein Q9163_002212 [Psora crenata]
MGWPWSATAASSGSGDGDPFRDLDPSLRDFLEKESPRKYKPAPAPPPLPPEGKASQQPSASQTKNGDAPESRVPSESLFPDGRYAHLWKTYRPLSAVENETKSDQEKLLDVLEGYKTRKAQIGRAAVENCVEEQMSVRDCYENGSVSSRMMLCRGENRAFERCYVMQSRFLKALGYLNSYDRPESVDEQIQMRADTLYHRMLAQERAVEEAKAAGRPIPEFRSILSPDQRPLPTTTPTEASAGDIPQLSPATIRALTPEAAAALRERMKPLDAFGREAEERSTMAELQAAADASRRLNKVNDERRRKAKADRRGHDEEGNDTGWFEWLVRGPKR